MKQGPFNSEWNSNSNNIIIISFFKILRLTTKTVESGLAKQMPFLSTHKNCSLQMKKLEYKSKSNTFALLTW